MTLLSVSNVGISFGATELFKNITFTVADGERWGIIGRNGAGKTSIAVDHTLPVRVIERGGERRRDAHRLVDRELFLAIQPRAQALPLDERHDVKEQPAYLSTVEEREEVRMLEVRRDFDLAEEPVGAEDGGEFGVEHLERDAAVVPEIVREVDGRHPTTPDHTFHVIPVGEPRSEEVEWVERRHRWPGRKERAKR